MSLTVDLPPEALQRLQAEADRRKLTIEDVIAELAAALPSGRPERPKRLSFAALGGSGDTRAFDIHRERDELAARKAVDGA